MSSGFRYCLVYRPAGLGTVPRSLTYEVEERPAKGQAHHDMARHGILVTERSLTTDELRAFELAPVIEGEEIDKVAQKVADEMSSYASEYLEVMVENPGLFRGRVAQGVERIEKGVMFSIADLGALEKCVATRLRALA